MRSQHCRLPINLGAYWSVARRWQAKKCLVWDATCVDTFVPSNLIRSTLHPGQADADADRRKRSKYMGIMNTYEIQPVAFETSGVCGPHTLCFLNKVGHIATECRHEPRERLWLIDWLSIAILCGNATAILSASPNSHCH